MPSRLSPSLAYDRHANWRAVILALALLLISGGPAAARPAEWTAQWISHPQAEPNASAVLHFRRSFDLAQRPERFVVHVSADNRYRLFVNGTELSSGPARGDVMHWRYETVDLAPHLRRGRNTLAAIVWNWGEHRPVAQMSHRTGLVVQGEGDAAGLVDSGDRWQVFASDAHSFQPVLWPDNGGYYVAAPGETIDGSRYPWGWEAPEFDDRQWTAAQPLVVRSEAARGALPRGSHSYGEGGEWQLVPRDIPPMEESETRFARVARAEGVLPSADWLLGRKDLFVPAGSRVSILLDQAHLTTAYPILVASGGAGASATLTYAEALFAPDGTKGNRNEIAGKTIRGVKDRILFDGGARRTFRPLWFRTYRYVQLDLETAEEPLRIHDLHGIFTAYPFRQQASFASDQGWIGDVWDIDWRVFRLSAFETFWDTPYYEQLQYIGDTRIESLISLYNAGDDRLMRNAIALFDSSRIPEGLTASRYPSTLPQYIPPFSLWWVAMVHDYWMHRDDPTFVRGFLPGVRGVLAWYERHIDETGMLGPMPWWNFLDWSPAYERGVPPGAEDGNSTALTFQYAYVLQRAAALEDALGQPAEGRRYRDRADALVAAARRHAWDEGRGLFADTPEKRLFGQQTNALAVLVGAVPTERRQALMETVLADASLIQASFYFRFYVDEALREADLANSYLARLEPWREMIARGLTTTPENPEPTRSDSHAWSAHPNYHLLATLLGIRPAAPGFRSVSIAPALGPLQHAEGKMPHPLGPIAVRFEAKRDGGLSGEVTLPPGLSGTLEWRGRTLELGPGTRAFDF